MNMAISVQRSAFLEAIQEHNSSSTAVVNHDDGASFSYGTLLQDVACAKERLMCSASKGSIAGERVAFLVENGYNYVGMKCPLPLFLCRSILTMTNSHLAIRVRMQCYCCTSGPVVSNG
jgi:hypothetical protein